jgi:hypothetical protein
MFARSLVVEGLILKEEADPDCVQAVRVNEVPVEYSVQDGYLRVCLMTPPGEIANVRVVYRNTL